MLVSDFDYVLPPELVAQLPAAERGASRLLHLDAGTGTLQDLKFADLPAWSASRTCWFSTTPG